MRTLFPLLILLGTLTVCSANDDCFNASSIPLQSGPSCDAAVSTITFNSLTGFTALNNSCDGSIPNDFWLHVNVSSISNIIIRKRAGTSIDAKAELLYAGSCPVGSSCCFSPNPVVIGCYDFEDFPNAIVLESAAPGDYYIRVWDSMNATSGVFNVSASILPSNIDDWILCDDISGEGSGFKANQLIVKPGPNFDVSIFDPGFALVDSCACTDPQLYLFEAGDFETFLEGEITAKQDPCIEGTSYNYQIDDRLEYDLTRCSGTGNCDPFPNYKPINPQYRVRVAIIDSGVNIDHEAFDNAHWTNKEADDNDNCLIGDLLGYDFQFDDAIPQDSIGHGSAVAGTVVENFPDDIQLELMSLKFHNGDSGFLFDAICGIHYAVDEGASIIVNSWGFYTAENPILLEDAFAKASVNGTLMVVSAGNDGVDIDNHPLGKYPAVFGFNNILTVSALDEVSFGVRGYANTGQISVDLVAVDHVIAPTRAQVGTTFQDVDSVAGTSISAPMVARTAAIIKGRFPILQYADIRNCILNTVTATSGLSGVVFTKGYLDHDAALLCAESLAMTLSCSNEFMRIQGTIINDLQFATSDRILTNATIEDPSTVTMQAQLNVETLAGFEVESGSTFTSIVESCN